MSIHAPHFARRSLTAGAAILALALLPLAVVAQAGDVAPPTQPDAAAPLSYALGLTVIDSPTYAGSAGREQKLRPLWSVRYGRYRLSGSRSSGLLGPTTPERGSGATADLIEGPRWTLGLGLRFDNGRSSSDDPALAGLPDIRRTLRARLNSNVKLGAGLSTSMSYSTDLLGRGGGAQLGWSLGYAWAPWAQATASVGVGATWADRQHMQTYFGVTPAVAQASGRTAFAAGAGLSDLQAGAALQVPLGGHWVLMGGLGLTRLQGDAAASPLTRRASGATASVALAWRSR